MVKRLKGVKGEKVDSILNISVTEGFDIQFQSHNICHIFVLSENK